MGKTSKVVVCGTNNCGKTSILEQVIYGKVGVSYSLRYKTSWLNAFMEGSVKGWKLINFFAAALSVNIGGYLRGKYRYR